MKNKLKKFCIKKGIPFIQIDKYGISVDNKDIPKKHKAKFEWYFSRPRKTKKSKKEELAPKLKWAPMFTDGVPRIWHSHKPEILNKISQPESLTKEALRDLTEPRTQFVGNFLDGKIREVVQTELEAKLYKSVIDTISLIDENGIQPISFTHGGYEIHCVKTTEQIEKKESIEMPENFCVEITKENTSILAKIKMDFHNSQESFLDIDSFIHSNAAFTYCYSSNVSHDNNRVVKLVSTEEFLKYIGKENLLTKEKLYTQEQMLNCFNESRLTHPMVGFKHDSFSAYLDSLEK